VVKKEVRALADEVSNELKGKVVEYLKTVSKAKNKEVAKAIDVDKHLVDKAIAELSKEGKIEYIYLGASFIKLKDA
jgi:Mn-dependent DtxR family transcriptional regulator